MKIRSKVLLAPSVAIVMLVMIAAFAVAMTWQLKSQITAFHSGALKQYEASLTARGRLNEAHALAYRTLTWSANLSKEELVAARQEDRRGDCRHGRAARRRPQGTARSDAVRADLQKFAKTLDRAMELSAVEVGDGIAMMRDADKLAVRLGETADLRVREANLVSDGLFRAPSRRSRQCSGP